MLKEFQTSFKDKLFGDPAKLEARLHIYRNNMFFGLTQALRDMYPVLYRLVGKDFFRQAAKRFIIAHPPREGYLIPFGSEFPCFIQDLARDLVYLRDVGTLEWAYHQAYHAVDKMPLSATDLQQVRDLPNQKMILHPSAHFVESDFPIARIWEVNRQEQDASIDLSVGGGCFLVIRPHLEVEIHSLPTNLAIFLKNLQAGQTVQEAFEKMMKENFGLQTAFQTLLLAGVFVPSFESNSCS